MLILHLDRALAAYREKYGRDPEMINVAEDYTHYYKHMPLDINVHGIPVRIESKPAWFRFPRIFKAQ